MRTSQIMLTAAACIVIIAGMKAATVILVPFLLSAFIAIISAPPMFWLQRKGVPAVLAVSLVVLLILGIGIIIAALAGQSINQFTQDLPVYQTKIKAQTASAIAILTRLGIDTSSLALTEIFDPGAAMKLAASVLNGLGNMLTNGFLILMTVIFMLLEASSFPVKLQAIKAGPEASLTRWENFLAHVKQYMAIKTWVSLATGIIITIWLAILGIDFPLLWGVLAFALNYVPNIGSIIAAVPAVLLAMIQLGLTKALFAAGGYVAVNLLMGNLVEPRFMGKGLGLSTLVVFLSLLFWGWVLGPVGMLLSVPLTITAKIALDSQPDTRWLAVLLGPESGAQSSAQTGPEAPDTAEDGTAT
ncbi:MAG: AI-2E family transporter [Desulfobacteraceae bacterium]